MAQFLETEEKISELELTQFSEELELKLPEAYKLHILENNGGYPENEYFKNIHVHYFYAIKKGEYPLEEKISNLKDVLPINYFPFTSDEGGNQVCISLNEEDYGKVYFCPMDMGEVKPEFLANSFTEFLEGLSEDDDY
jgi:hypothetical protein